MSYRQRTYRFGGKMRTESQYVGAFGDGAAGAVVDITSLDEIEPQIADNTYNQPFPAKSQGGGNCSGADGHQRAGPCRLAIELRDGTHLSAECLYPSGHSFPDQGLDQSVVEEKYFEVVRGALAPVDARAVLDDVLSIEEDGRLQSLMGRLALAPTR